MKVLLWVPLLAMLHRSKGQMGASAPRCAVQCWENTQYVSNRKCTGDAACLCTEPDYQNAVFQCLYSQCDTVHFGFALHHIIARCFGTGFELPLFAAPPVPNREDLRRREEEYAAGAKLYGSGSVVGYPTESMSFPTQSAGYATQSVGGPYTASPTSTPPPFFVLNTTTSPAMISPTPTDILYNAIPVVTTASAPQQMLTRFASALGLATIYIVLALVAALYIII
ncbi:hypothetical protein L207DRAFT_628946 [Hyaloscypha variabilis F]|uniref:CFEM domain-containing protein n=1 Tax=Hyaloscypha variabilis (strain UAMH 11265 / GT02V1 / F) TaxID=1149755 RepID=A0A2J6S6N0_HYAVF|nr:hypothetical protein L207DRAFT_628946 [Hyaloscypha variabilis F]